jgi:undecaprenyl-diphosphatase
VWRALTLAGGTFLVLVAAALVVGLVALGRLRLAIVVAVALIGSTLFTDAAKDLVSRPRPAGDPLVTADGYSFPSGHSLNSAATNGIAALLIWRSSLPPRARKGLAATLVALVVSIGLSRIALGVHYPSDVVAGWLAGTAIVAVVALIDRADRARSPGRSRRRRSVVTRDQSLPDPP